MQRIQKVLDKLDPQVQMAVKDLFNYGRLLRMQSKPKAGSKVYLTALRLLKLDEDKVWSIMRKIEGHEGELKQMYPPHYELQG